MWQYIKAVAIRELRIWMQRPIYFVGSLGVILFGSIFFLTFFKAGLPSKLPIGVVDYDRSSLSRNFTRQLDATQIGEVVRFDDFRTAREAMQRGSVTSICVIPDNFAADIQAFRRPTFTFYVNGLYFVGGSLAYQDILTMINLTSGAVQKQILTAKGVSEYDMMGRLRPIYIDVHRIGNTMTNYGVYLNNLLLPGLLQMIIILTTIYAFGTELKYSTSRNLMEKAGGSITNAVLGKLLVYTLYFTAVGISMVCLLYVWLRYPLAGSIWSMMLNMVLMVLACEAVALTIVGLIPVCRFAISIGALYSVLGFSLAGFTLPVEAMPPFLQGISVIFPLRHYYLFYVQEAMFASGFAGWYQEVVHLLLFLLLPFPILLRLKNAYINMDYPKK
ncbi:MAG: ABC transporter permease [Bacteroidales bacterium]|nr:ABC transporter permease [Bacteroidales bacterium]